MTEPKVQTWRCCAPNAQCRGKHYARGYCRRHFHALVLNRPGARDIVDGLPRHAWDLVDKSGDCWLWNGLVGPEGYGELNFAGAASRSPHRLTWAAVNGPIPEGWEVDHLCHSQSDCRPGRCDHRRCVNPAHLEALDAIEHRRRQRRGVCAAGLHAMTPENTYVRSEGQRWCRVCRRIRDNALRDRKCHGCGMSKVNPVPRSHYCNECIARRAAA